ncbi:MAG: prohibitin family protein [Bacteroidales bacterium]|nr:prohibitin family protein [Bacteroidales bacterium]
MRNTTTFNMKKAKLYSTLALILGVFIFFLATCTKMVDNSEIGIKFKKFSLTDQGELVANQVSGLTFFNPITTRVFTYPVYIQRVNYDPFTVTTKDAATFTMDPMMAYQLDRTKAAYVFNKYRKSLREIEMGYIRTCIYDAYRISANNYTSDELMANRAKFEQEVRTMLERSLNEEGFKVQEFTSQITPPQSLSAAIEAKNQAIQEALKAENLVKQAEANAQIAIAKAKGEAEATRVKADAEAYYNRTISASLSPFIIQEDWIEKWNGQLPQVTSGQGGMMINLPSLGK